MRTAPEALRALLSYRLQRAAFYATRPAYQAFGREFGVTGVEWRLLANLAGPGPVSLAEVAAEADVQVAQASRAVAGLVARGLVRRATDPDDARHLALSLTPAGRTLLRRLHARAEALNDAVAAGLDARERRTLLALLDRVAEGGRALMAAAPTSASARRSR